MKLNKMNNDLIGICTKIGISIGYIDSFLDRFPDPGFGSGWFSDLEIGIGDQFSVLESVWVPTTSSPYHLSSST